MKRSRETKVSKNKEICSYFFIKEGDTNIYQCRLCLTRRTQVKGSGKTNLMSHIVKEHPAFDDIMQRNPDPKTLRSHFSSKVLTIFSWLDWVNGDGLSFNFIEKPRTKEYTKLPSISVDTLMKYIHELTEELETKISTSILPDKFALIFDGWSLDGTSTHYVALFASFLVSIVFFYLYK
jgi:hypothetical protein